jgi:hypothetical protein
MAKKICITSGDIRADAELNDSPTAQQIWNALPIEARANTWGDEVYFAIPVQADSEPDARAEVAIGELGYWPAGSAFCIFFGLTPASSGDAPQAASPVNVLGRVLGDAAEFKALHSGDAVRIEAAE